MSDIVTGEHVVNKAPYQVAETIDMFAAINKLAKNDLLELLERKHAEYDLWNSHWETMGDVALNRVDSVKKRKRYLVEGASEEDQHFDERANLSQFLPETPMLLSDFVGTVFNKSVQREIPSRATVKLEAFVGAADSEGNALDIVSEKAAELALVFGSVDAFLDHPLGEKTTEPYITLYTPDKRLDWQAGQNGFKWVKYREKYWDKPFWTDKPRLITEYRIVGRLSILTYRTYEAENKTVIEVLDGLTGQWASLDEAATMVRDMPDHGFPETPVVTLYWNQLQVGIGDPWVKPLVHADIKVFRQESDITWDIFVHAHPWVAAWLHKGEQGEASPLDRIKLGANWAMHLDPGISGDRNAEDMKYIAPDSAELELQLKAASDTRELVRRMSGSGVDMTRDEQTPESGVALAYRQAEKSKNFATLARGLAEWEWKIFELVMSEGNATLVNVDGLEIKYPDRFDVRSKMELDVDRKSASDIGSPTLVKAVNKIQVPALLGTSSTPELIRMINDEIDNAEDVEYEEYDDDEKVLDKEEDKNDFT